MGKAKTIGVGMDYSATSKLALRWTFDNLIEAGDLVVVIHVLSPKSDPTNKQLFEDTGSRKSDLVSGIYLISLSLRHLSSLQACVVKMIRMCGEDDAS